jgi:hypothetical protein
MQQRADVHPIAVVPAADERDQIQMIGKEGDLHEMRLFHK